MNKTPYFLHYYDGTFVFLGYFDNKREALIARGAESTDLVDASFLYRTVTAANEALNNMPAPEGVVR